MITQKFIQIITIGSVLKRQTNEKFAEKRIKSAIIVIIPSNNSVIRMYNRGRRLCASEFVCLSFVSYVYVYVLRLSEQQE